MWGATNTFQVSGTFKDVFGINSGGSLSAGNYTVNGTSWSFPAITWFGYNGTNYYQFGTATYPVSSCTLSTSAISGNITQVVVRIYGASNVSGTVSVSVGGTAYKYNSTDATSASFNSTATNYTFTGSSSGTLSVTFGQTTSKAIYLASITTTYSTSTSVSLTKAGETNGSITLSPASSVTTTSDADVTVTAEPDPGYYLSNLTATNPTTTGTATVAADFSKVTYSSGASGSSTITATFSPIWQLRGTFNSYAATDPCTTIEGTGASTTASATVTLAKNTKYMFQFFDATQATDAAAYHGNNGNIVEDVSGWDFATGSPSPDCKIFTGKAGSYTFKINLSTKKVQVIYPTVTDHPNDAYNYFKKWADWNDNYFVHWWGASDLQPYNNAIQVTKTYSSCNNDYVYFPILTDYPNFIVKDAASGDGDHKTGNLSSTGNGAKYYDFEGWKTFGTYSITFAGNGSDGGSMSNVTCISSGSNETLAANGFTKTDYTFTGWKADVAVTIGGSSVPAGTLIPDESTIQNITSNITLTAQWSVVQDRFIDALQNTSGYTEGSPHTETGTYSTPSLSDKSVATSGTCQQQHYHFVGWITAAKYAAGTAISDGDLQTPTSATNATYYAVWAKGSGSGTASYKKVTSTSAITSNGRYLIVYETGQVAFDGAHKKNSVITLDDPSNTVSTGTISNNAFDVTTDLENAEFVIDVTNKTLRSKSGYYIGHGSYANGLTQNSSTSWEHNAFSIDNSGNFVAAIQIPETLAIQLKYNTTSGQTRFRYFKSGQADIQLYKYDPGVTYTDYKAACEAETCGMPTTPTSSPTAFGATLGWTGNATGTLDYYEYAVWADGEAEPVSGYTSAATNSASVSGLLSNTDYNWKVRKVCTGTDGNSEFLYGTFTTSATTLTFNVPSGVTQPSSQSSTTALPTPTGTPTNASICWKFVGWTTAVYDRASSLPATFFEAGDYAHVASGATTLYAVYVEDRYEWFSESAKFVAGKKFLITFIAREDPDSEYALSSEVTGTYYAAGVDIVDHLRRVDNIYNPAANLIWELQAGSAANTWRLYNAANDKYINLSNDNNPILSSTGADLIFGKHASDFEDSFYTRDASVTTNFITFEEGNKYDIADKDDDTGAGYNYMYRLESTTYTTHPDCSTYTVTWHIGTTTETSTVNQCDGITSSDIPDVADDELSCSTSSTRFMGWSDTNSGSGEGHSAPSRLYTYADEFPEVTGNVHYYGTWATQTTTSTTTKNDLLNQSVTGITGSNYEEFSDVTVTNGSGAVYAGICAGSNSSIQLRIKNSEEGVITTGTGGLAKKVTVVWESHTTSGRAIDVYGKNSPYSAASDLFGANAGTKIGSIECGESTELTIDDDYEYIGIRAGNGALYLTSITIKWEQNTYTYSDYISSCCSGLAINLDGDPAGTLTGGQIATNVPTACYQEEVSLIVAATNSGYNFSSWSVTGATSGNTVTVTDNKFTMPNEAVNVTAIFESAHTTTVTLDPQGGTGGTASVTATINLPMPEATMPTKSGYVFGGYYTAPNGSGTQYYTPEGGSARNWDNSTEDETTLYAKWISGGYTIVLNNQSATTPGTPNVSAVYGTNTNLTSPITCPTKTDNTFGGYWTETGGSGVQLIDADGNWIPSVTNYTGDNKQWLYAGDLELFANWSSVSYTNYRTDCGPEIEVTGTVKLTGYPGCEVLTPSNALIAVSSSDWKATELAPKVLNFRFKDMLSGVTYTHTSYNTTGTTQKIVNSEFRILNADGNGGSVADGNYISIDNGTTSATYNFRIAYTPQAGVYNIQDHYILEVEVMTSDHKTLTLETLDLYGRALPEQFVIAAKKDGVWYALPNDLAGTEAASNAAKAVEIVVDNTTTPTTAVYAPENTLYKGDVYYGKNNEITVPNRNRSGVRFTRNGSQWLQISTVEATNLMWLSKSGGTDVQDWYLNSSDFTVYSVKIDPRAGTTGYLAKQMGIYGSNFGFYASLTAGAGDIYFLPVSTVLAEAEVVEWGVHKAIVEVDAGSTGLNATQVIARIGSEASKPLSISQTQSGSGGATKYNWTINVGNTFDFTTQKDEKLYLDWLNSSGTVVGTSMIPIPWLIDGEKTMATIDGTAAHWEKAEVHVLNGATLTANGGSFAGSNVTIGHLEIYPGATVKVTTGTVNTTNLVLRYGWTRVDGKAYDYARMYIVSTANLTHSSGNAYADWYIDYDRYYSMAVPWSVSTNKITYKNSNNAASAGVKILWYDGEQRATTGQSMIGQNWKEYTWGNEGDMPSTLDPSKGYALTAKRPGGKAFSIVRMPLTFTNAWTTLGEQGEVNSEHKNQVSVTGWGKGSAEWYAMGWNFIANPYMATFNGNDDGIIGKLQDQEGKGIRYVTKPDLDFQSYDQVPIEDADLEPARGFFIQANNASAQTITFVKNNIEPPSAAPARFMNVDEALPEQEAYIRLSYEGGKDQMGLIIGDEYTEEYEVNADLAKVLGEGNFVKTYMNYGGMDMAYVAINATLAKNWIPVTVKIPANGEYTFSLMNSSVVDELDGVYLIDYANGDVITNLIGNDYVFTAEEGTITDRFAINAIYGERETPTKVDALNSNKFDSDKPIKFLYHEKVYILYHGIIYDAVGKRVREINK